jgi:hypothetical protein
LKIKEKYMIKTNVENLVKTSVVGEISPPSASGYRINVEGKPMVLPGVGGITYNISGKILPKMYPKANIANILKLRDDL